MQPQLIMLQKTMVVVEGVARQLDPKNSIWDSARPIIEQWMIDSVGPQARIQDATEGLTALGRALSALPETLKSAENIAVSLSNTGIKIHPDSARAISTANRSASNFSSWAIGIGIAVLILIFVKII